MSKWDAKTIAAQDSISPNLIPMVDIMFLLLLFLMLGSDMSQREIEFVVLPKTQYSTEDKPKPGSIEKERTTINVYHLGINEIKCDAYANHETCRDETHWRISVRGTDFLTTDDRRFTDLLKDESGLTKTDKPEKLSERKVMLRADGSAPYRLVQGVMYACSKARMYKLECGAALIKPEITARER